MARLTVWILVLLLEYLSIEANPPIVRAAKMTLVVRFYPEGSSKPAQMRNSIRILSTNQIETAYWLTGETMNATSLRVLSVRCVRLRCVNCSSSSTPCQSSSLILDSVTDNTTALQLVESRSTTAKLLHQLSSNDTFLGNLTCTLTMLYDDAKEFQFRPQEKNNLLSTILLVASVALSLILCFGWCAVLTYRECKYARLKRKRKKEMMKSVQQLLELSPTILFDASEKNSDSVDEDPSCAICLEPFADQDRLRKLVCSHSFHLACIDPWLVSRQSCPLCNRNILEDSIPSISRMVMFIVNRSHSPAPDPTSDLPGVTH